MLQLTISEIKNGYLIAIPPEQSVIERAQRNGGPQPNGTIIHCKDYLGTVRALKEYFPTSETKTVIVRDLSITCDNSKDSNPVDKVQV